MAAAAYKRFDPPAVRVSVDERARRIVVEVSGPASGPQVADPVSRLFLEQPDLCAFDMLYDLMLYNGDVGADDIDPIVEAYARCEPDLTLKVRTAFVTPDPYFQHWAKAMDEQFAGREHRAFRRREDALAFLETPQFVRRRGH
jgi:hypothetical protein